MKRDLCERCARPTTVCYCRALIPVAAPVRLLLLQPAKERKRPLNTGRILALGISNCDRFEGEDFSEHEALRYLLKRYRGRTWLLYPGEDAIAPKQMLSIESAGERLLPTETLLVVLDATWKKSRKMLYLCRALASLPRVALPHDMTSNYRLRKVPGDGYLSTVEATTAVLAELGHPTVACEQMLTAFDTMIATQIKAMGEDVWQRNYSKQA